MCQRGVNNSMLKAKSFKINIQYFGNFKKKKSQTHFDETSKVVNCKCIFNLPIVPEKQYFTLKV